MNWKIKALLQKILSLTRLGDTINHIPATFNKNYHFNVTLYQTHECIRKFNYCNLDFSKNNTALEIGTGYSLISSIILALLGFKKIITVDITKDIKLSTLKKQVSYLDQPEILELISSKSIFSKQQLITKIKALKKIDALKTLFSLLNITYITPYTFNTILKHETKFNYISSQVVLEHVSPKILDSLFQFTKKVLTKDDFCVHTINFIDHFANLGFFQDHSISEFNFLKYSNKYWKFWAGNSIAYTNRLSYLYYLELCKKHDLNCIDFIGENYRIRKELDVDLIHPDVLKNYKSDININDLTRYQRGTLILSNN
jgi:hypothetical protein